MIVNKKIFGRRIYLRSLTDKDATEEYCRWLNDPVVNKYLETRNASIESLKRYIQEKNEKEDCLFFGIFDRANDRHIGNIKLEPIVSRKVTFSILIGNKEYWGGGIGTEATKLLVNYAFDVLKVDVVDLGVISENKAAIRVYEKVGFTVKSVVPKAVNHDGILYDQVMMEIRKPKLVLGTVQLGLNYGINNQKGKPKREDALRLLERAYELGVRIFDTAPAYGDAEELLGEFISDSMREDCIRVVSKLRSDMASDMAKAADDEMLNIVEKEIRMSLSRLRKSYLDGYLLHDPKQLRNKRIISALRKCKEKGIVTNIGVSIYEESDALYAVNSGFVDYIQIPYNVFDRRLNKTDFFALAKKNNVTVFARSAFLQGLMLMKDEEIPSYLERAKDYLREFDMIIRKYGLTRIQAALLFLHNTPGIDYIVVGFDNVEQLEQTMDILASSVDYSACFQELSGKFVEVDRKVISPNLWQKP